MLSLIGDISQPCHDHSLADSYLYVGNMVDIKVPSTAYFVNDSQTLRGSQRFKRGTDHIINAKNLLLSNITHLHRRLSARRVVNNYLKPYRGFLLFHFVFNERRLIHGNDPSMGQWGSREGNSERYKTPVNWCAKVLKS